MVKRASVNCDGETRRTCPSHAAIAQLGPDIQEQIDAQFQGDNNQASGVSPSAWGQARRRKGWGIQSQTERWKFVNTPTNGEKE